MFFDDQDSKGITGYGIGTAAAEGRYHLLAALEDARGIRMLCLSTPRTSHRFPSRSVKWFKDENRAVQALRSHKKACQKCLRSIETMELSGLPSEEPVF